MVDLRVTETFDRFYDSTFTLFKAKRFEGIYFKCKFELLGAFFMLQVTRGDQKSMQ